MKPELNIKLKLKQYKLSKFFESSESSESIKVLKSYNLLRTHKLLKTAAAISAAFVCTTSLFLFKGNPDSITAYAKAGDRIEVYTPAYAGREGKPVADGVWEQDKNGRWSYTTNALFRSIWGYIANPYAKEGQNYADWYYFDSDGYMVTGWLKLDNHWYYLNEETGSGNLGARITGWKTGIPGCGDNYYYFGSDGALYTSCTTPDGYRVDGNGVRIG